MDNKQVLPQVPKNATTTRQTQVFVLPPELLKGLFLQNKIPKINDPKTVALTNNSKNVEEEQKEEKQLSDCLITNDTNKINADKNVASKENSKAQSDAIATEPVQNSSLNVISEKTTKISASKRKIQESNQNEKQSSLKVDTLKQSNISVKKEIIKKRVVASKKTRKRKKRITKILKPNVTDSINQQNVESQKKNIKHIENDNSHMINNKEIDSEVINKLSKKPESNKSIKIKNKNGNTCTKNEKNILEISNSGPFRNTRRKISNSLIDSQSIDVSKHIDKHDDNEKIENLSRSTSNKTEKITNDVQPTLKVLHKFSNTTESIDTNVSRQKRNSRITKPINIIKNEPEIASQNIINIDNFPYQSCAEGNSDDVSQETCLEQNVSNSYNVTTKIIHSNELITTDTQIKKVQINVDTSSVETKNSTLDILDTTAKSTDANQTRYSRRKRITKISKLSEINNFPNNELMTANPNESEIDISDCSTKTFLGHNTEVSGKETLNTKIEKVTFENPENFEKTSTDNEKLKNFKNSSTDIKIGKPTRYSRRTIAKFSKSDEIINASKNIDKNINKEFLPSKKDDVIAESNIDDNNINDKSNELTNINQLSNLENINAHSHLTDVSQTRYSNRKRITKISKPNETINSFKIKQKTMNINQSEAKITINDLPIENSKTDIKMVKNLEANNKIENNIMTNIEMLKNSKTNDTIIIENSETNIEHVKNLDADTKIVENLESDTSKINSNIFENSKVLLTNLKIDENNRDIDKVCTPFNDNNGLCSYMNKNNEEFTKHEQIEIIEEIEYVVEEVLAVEKKQNVHVTDDIAVYDTTDYINDIEKSSTITKSLDKLVSVNDTKNNIQSDTFSKITVDKYKNPSITVTKTVSNENHDQIVELNIKDNNSCTQNSSLPILTVRRYSAKSRKKNSTSNSSSNENDNVKCTTRNRSQSTHQIIYNEPKHLNTRMRSVSLNINSSNSKQIKSESSTIIDEVSFSNKTLKHEINQDYLNKTRSQKLIEDSIHSDIKSKEHNTVEIQKDKLITDTTIKSFKTHKSKLWTNSTQSINLNTISNEIQVDLNNINEEEEDLNVDIDKILNTLAMEDSKDKEDHSNFICNKNNGTMVDESIEPMHDLISDEIQNTFRRSKSGCLNSHVNNEKSLTNCFPDNIRQENEFIKDDELQIHNSIIRKDDKNKQIDLDIVSQNNKYKTVIDEFQDNDLPKSIIIKNSVKCNEEIDKLLHNTEVNKQYNNESMVSKDNENIREIQEIKNSIETNKDNQFDTKLIIENNSDENKIEYDSDNYESSNILFINDNCSSISSSADLNKEINKNFFHTESSGDLIKTNENVYKNDEMQERGKKYTADLEDNIEKLIDFELIHDSEAVDSLSLSKRSCKLNFIQSKDDEEKSKIKDVINKRVLKQTSMDSFIVKNVKESPFKLSISTEGNFEKASNISSNSIVEPNVSADKIEIMIEGVTTKKEVSETNYLNEVSEENMASTVDIEFNNIKDKNIKNNFEVECQKNSLSNIKSIPLNTIENTNQDYTSVPDSGNNIETKLDGDTIISISTKEDLKAINNKLSSPITESDIESKTRVKNLTNRDTNTVPVSVEKKRRGRPPKSVASAKKMIDEKSENDKINNLDVTTEDIFAAKNNLQKEVENNIKMNRLIETQQKRQERPSRSCKLVLLEERRRSARNKTDNIDHSSDVLLRNSRKRKQSRRSIESEEKSETSEDINNMNIDFNKDKSIDNLNTENVECQVKRRRGRPRLKPQENCMSINNNMHNENCANSNIVDKISLVETPKIVQNRRSRRLISDTKSNHEISNENTNYDIVTETNINKSIISSKNTVDIALTDTRKRKKSIKDSSQANDKIEPENSSIDNQDTIAAKEKDNENDDDNVSVSDDEETVLDTVKNRKYPVGPYKRRRRGKRRGRPPGRQRKSICDNDYIPHHSHLGHSSKKEISTKSNFSAALSVKKMVTCGKCNAEITKSQWPHHNLMTHNDLGWLIGSIKPDYENDEKLYKKILNFAHKKRKRTLICEQCKVIKRSVAGYLSHLTFCGKSEEEIKSLMVKCPVCHAITKPSSMEYHDRMHKMEAEAKAKMPEMEIECIDSGLRGKRKAAEKAVSRISEFTALVKDDKDTVPFGKKLKMNTSSMKKFILKPQLQKRIPSTAINKWQKDLASGRNATCSQIGCQFTSSSFDEIKSHYATCNFTPQENYVCKLCRFQSLSESEIVRHTFEKHSPDDEDANVSLSDAESSSSDNLSDNECNNKNQGVIKKFYFKESSELSNKLFKFIFKDGTCHTKFNKTFIEGFQWTLEFERRNYQFSLFEEYTANNFELLSSKDFVNYLPELEQSMPMITLKSGVKNDVEPEWKKWKRFEGLCCEENPTFFVGGPVWAIAWLPIPTLLALSENISQFIAVSSHRTMDVMYDTGKAYSGKNIIQIWDVGYLDHQTNSQCNPKLAYAIAHEGGTIWCLEWCPSGCYQNKDLFEHNDNNKLNRMGLLAAGCSDGCVRIYSIIFPNDLVKGSSEYINSSDKYLIYNTEPVLILVINRNMYENEQQNWQVTKLSWTKQKNHNVIVAGFSNGYVALWDLTLKSPLLKYKKGNTVFLNAQRHFFAHHHAVTMVHLIPQDNKRFLATASIDRLYKLWDLEDITNPKNFIKKSFVTDGSWLNHWCTAFIAYDDSLSMGHNYSYCLPLRDYTYKYFNMFPTNSPSYSISASDYGNSIANGTLAGEILAIFPQQLIYIRDMEKTLPRKRYMSMISSSEVVDFQKVPESEDESKNRVKEALPNEKNKKNGKVSYNFLPMTYEDSKDRFGIKFYDKLNDFRELCLTRPKSLKKTLTIEMMQNVPVEQYPFMSVNRLAWNPNASSFLWLAAGYQNGFVRLISFKSMASPTEYNKMLTSHIQNLQSDYKEFQSTKVDYR